jgi:hypothetical protein
MPPKIIPTYSLHLDASKLKKRGKVLLGAVTNEIISFASSEQKSRGYEASLGSAIRYWGLNIQLYGPVLNIPFSTDRQFQFRDAEIKANSLESLDYLVYKRKTKTR